MDQHVRRDRRPSPTSTLNDGHTIPQLGFGVFQIQPAETVAATATGPRDRLPAHRHRRDVRQRAGGGRGGGPLRARPVGGVRHQQAQQRLPPARRRPAGLRPDARRPRLRLRRPVPHPLAPPHPLRRRLRVHLADPDRVPARRAGPGPSGCPTSSPTTSTGWPTRPTWCRRSTRSRSTLPDPGGAAAVRRRPRHRHRGLVAHRPGPGPRRPGHRVGGRGGGQDARPRWCCGGTSSGATSSSPSR